MARRGPSDAKWFTKKRKARIAQLGGEWAVLDSKENHIFRLIRELYEKLEPGTKRPQELAELEREQMEISERKREISAELIAVEEGSFHLKRRPPGRGTNPFVLVRDKLIRELRDLSNEDICRRLDGELGQREMAPLGFPENWTKKYDVKSYLAAYRHRKCKALVQKSISVAKKSF
jgi:hypothetical protein